MAKLKSLLEKKRQHQQKIPHECQALMQLLAQDRQQSYSTKLTAESLIPIKYPKGSNTQNKTTYIFQF